MFRISIMTAMLAAVGAPSLSQSPGSCAPRQAVIQQLMERYGESQRSIGLGADNSVVEVFASDATGTWTIIVTRADGISCLVAAGQAFESIAAQPAAPGSDA